MVMAVGLVVATLQSAPTLASLKSREHIGLRVRDDAAPIAVAVAGAPDAWPLANHTAQAAATVAARGQQP